ncbi:uncharacterized protein H6S33_009881 [Morchella sextelata]|uniref:uncharacterized protein n=1 Tax=Morchella sextelata TaxID=1174677 RepID=UPI001D056E45|nr:uncharacterized protein H6S33_009881 [Morchella sextelata]KAH0602240.1 hypothetical protein H6S33_009881 [Morchella sextelata]
MLAGGFYTIKPKHSQVRSWVVVKKTELGNFFLRHHRHRHQHQHQHQGTTAISRSLSVANSITSAFASRRCRTILRVQDQEAFDDQ